MFFMELSIRRAFEFPDYESGGRGAGSDIDSYFGCIINYYDC